VICEKEQKFMHQTTQNAQENDKSQAKTVPIYVLTVDEEGGQRKMHCWTVFNRLKLNPTFVQGFRWDNLPSNRVYSPWRNLVFSKRSLSAQEVAVYLGHRKIWLQILEGQSEVALVVEDDLSITDSDKFAVVLEKATGPRYWDILKLFDFAPKEILASHEWNGIRIVDYKYPPSGCVAYLITRDAAQRLLQRRHVYRPVDEDISWCWEFGLCVRSIFPNIVEEVSHKLGGSLIEDSRFALRKRKKLLRSLLGIVLNIIKQIRARHHLHRILHDTSLSKIKPPDQF